MKNKKNNREEVRLFMERLKAANRFFASVQALGVAGFIASNQQFNEKKIACWKNKSPHRPHCRNCIDMHNSCRKMAS